MVVYDSWTGHTEAVAKAIAQGLGTTAIDVRDNPPTNPGLLVVGSPVHFGATNRILDYLKTANPGSMAIFLTYGATGELARVTLSRSIKQMKKPGIKYLGTFICKGFHPILLLNPQHPNNQDLRQARKFGERLRTGIDIPAIGSGVDPNRAYFFNSWINQNLPFGCGISQGFQKGMPPSEYYHDPNNYCSSPRYFGWGYKIGRTVRANYFGNEFIV